MSCISGSTSERSIGFATQEGEELMTQFRSPWRFALLLAAATAFAMPVTSLPVQASVYDANILGTLKLKGSQRAQAQRIISQSRSQRSRVFKRYGINPNARPDIGKLQRASSELLAIGARERAALSRILNPTQLRAYDTLMSQVRSRVIRAAS
jgi:hypothetical protein